MAGGVQAVSRRRHSANGQKTGFLIRLQCEPNSGKERVLRAVFGSHTDGARENEYRRSRKAGTDGSALTRDCPVAWKEANNNDGHK